MNGFNQLSAINIQKMFVDHQSLVGYCAAIGRRAGDSAMATTKPVGQAHA